MFFIRIRIRIFIVDSPLTNLDRCHSLDVITGCLTVDPLQTTDRLPKSLRLVSGLSTINIRIRILMKNMKKEFHALRNFSRYLCYALYSYNTLLFDAFFIHQSGACLPSLKKKQKRVGPSLACRFLGIRGKLGKSE